MLYAIIAEDGLFHPHHATVEVCCSIDVGNRQDNVINSGDFHSLSPIFLTVSDLSF